LHQLCQELATLDHEIMALELEGTSNGSPHWRDGKHQDLILPTENGHRRREYIGNKVDKAQVALDSVKGYKRRLDLRRERVRVRSNLRDYIRRSLDLMPTEARIPGNRHPSE
jgi:hypothetical protein